MTIVTPTVTPQADGSALMAWSGTAGATVRVFVSGLLVIGPQVMDDADKSVGLDLPDPFTIEIHESNPDEDVISTRVPLQRTPLVWWRSVEGAVRYVVLIDLVPIASVIHEDWRYHHQYQVTEDIRINGIVPTSGSFQFPWRRLRVKAVDAAGNETVSDTHRDAFAPGVPLEPSAVAVTGGSGSFNITLTIPATS